MIKSGSVDGDYRNVQKGRAISIIVPVPFVSQRKCKVVIWLMPLSFLIILNLQHLLLVLYDFVPSGLKYL